MVQKNLGLIGSEKYCEKLNKDEIKNVIAVFNLDVCAIKDGIVRISANTKKFRSFLNEIRKKYNFNIKIGTNTGENSDHYPFEKRGVPVSFQTSSSNVYNYAHLDYDTLDKLDGASFQIPLLFIGISIFELANSDIKLL